LSGDSGRFSGGGGEGFPRPPLPRGRHRLTPEQVADDQRRRLFLAMAESVAARGYAATSVERVIELAGISRGTFYEHFANRRECLLAAHEAIFARFIERITGACAAEARWEDKATAAIGAAVEFATHSPEQVRLLTLDTIAADGETAQRGLAAAEQLATMLRGGREHHPQAMDLPEVTERFLVSAIAGAVNRRLLSGESLVGLEPQLVFLVLTPYVGTAVAARQAEKSASMARDR
jgi:AcrR family transcriptional regulator